MLIRSGEVALREFEEPLSAAVHEIRNHPSVRAHLRDTRPISRESHDRWVRENLLEARRLRLFVVHRGEEPQGIALLRNFSGRSAEVGLMMVQAERRRLVAYIAAHLVCYFGFERLGLEELYSYVPLAHAGALAFNLGCGFEPTGKPSDVYHELVLTRSRSRSHAVHKRFRASRKIVVT
jgi:RimJ/RimL family protein N-acetyltransferase